MFKNQSIAVTGASGGIGRAIAEMFIANGAKVAISDRESPAETAAEIGAASFVCDVTQEEAVKAFIKDAEAVNGSIDVFVANAGVGFGDPEHAAGASNKSWELSWGVNVMGPFCGHCLGSGAFRTNWQCVLYGDKTRRRRVC